jgi:hypothetical protein
MVLVAAQWLGYCSGMATGIVSALILAKPELLAPIVDALSGGAIDHSQITALNAFPAMFLLCVIACVAGSYATAPTEMSALKQFYQKTRPWGFWGPVHKALLADNPKIAKNTDFWRDAFNVVVGIIWQTAITCAPIFLVIQAWDKFAIAACIIAICTLVLKFTWWDTLRDHPSDAPKLEPA